ncbi:MAG: oligoendopeptidase F [bacterium]
MNRHPLRNGLILSALILWALAALPVPAADTGAIPQRSDIEDKYKWKLQDIFADDDAWETTFTSLKAGIGGFEKYEGHLGDSPQNLLNCLSLSDSLELISDNLYVYAYMKLDEDNRISKYQEMGDRISGLNAELSAAQSFIEPEILALDSEQLQSFLSDEAALEIYRFHLEDLMRKKKHILSDKEEALLALADPVIGSCSRIFTMLDDADISYGSIFDSDSNEVELTKQRYYRLLESSDRRVRRDASEAYNNAYLGYVNTLAATLSASVKRDYFLMKARGYNSCLEMSLDRYHIPVTVYHNLIEAVNTNLSSLHRLTALRKRILGCDTLYKYDMYVPLVPRSRENYPYEEAKKIVLNGLKPLGEKYLAEFENGLNGGWIDVFETEGKGSGGYQWGSYGTHPYILLNHSGSLMDVFTIAHEMGHALHTEFTNRNEPYVYSNYSLFIAEVGSTCNEALLMKYLLEQAGSKQEKMALLSYYIEQIVGTFFTQVMFAEFELAIHERVENGQALSADYMRQTYRDIYEKYWGPELVLDETGDLGCLRISHFYRQYYVYEYATGYAAAQAMSQRILEGKEGYLDTYFKFLSTGTSKYPVDILKDAGVDMTTPDPVDRTLALFGELVDEMERLLDES